MHPRTTLQSILPIQGVVELHHKHVVANESYLSLLNRSEKPVNTGSDKIHGEIAVRDDFAN